jgi:hypothetical protein
MISLIKSSNDIILFNVRADAQNNTEHASE